MIPWTSAAIIGLMIAALHYGRSMRNANAATAARIGGRLVDLRLAAAALRAIAATLVAAMLLGAPSAPSKPARPLVALDVSSSWTRSDPAGGRWAGAAATARALAAGDSLLLFGDSARAADSPPKRPSDRH